MARLPYNIYDDTRNIAKHFIENYKKMRFLETQLSFIENDNKVYVINKPEHNIFDLRELVGEYYYDLSPKKN